MVDKQCYAWLCRPGQLLGRFGREGLESSQGFKLSSQGIRIREKQNLVVYFLVKKNIFSGACHNYSGVHMCQEKVRGNLVSDQEAKTCPEGNFVFIAKDVDNDKTSVILDTKVT